jgi:hypothetical protein
MEARLLIDLKFDLTEVVDLILAISPGHIDRVSISPVYNISGDVTLTLSNYQPSTEVVRGGILGPDDSSV